MQRRFRSVISALAIFCYAVVGVGAIHADMLCVGIDGHVAFDGPAGNDTCHGESLSLEASSESGVELVQAGTVPDCVDFILPGRTVLKGQELVVEPTPVILAWIVAAALPSARTCSRAAPTSDHRASSARSLTSHRTTVLLI